jgi:hypothetical protein
MASLLANGSRLPARAAAMHEAQAGRTDDGGHDAVPTSGFAGQALPAPASPACASVRSASLPPASSARSSLAQPLLAGHHRHARPELQALACELLHAAKGRDDPATSKRSGWRAMIHVPACSRRWSPFEPSCRHPLFHLRCLQPARAPARPENRQQRVDPVERPGRAHQGRRPPGRVHPAARARRGTSKRVARRRSAR